MPIKTNNHFSTLLALCAFLLLLSSGCEKVDAPELVSLEPELGPRETLVVMKGSNLGEIRELTFNDSIVPFNTAYNSDVALLFRIPTNISLGEKRMVVRTDGGSFETTFTVTEDPPILPRFFPRVANPGDLINLVGENFFEPLCVTFKTGDFVDEMFTDSVKADIVFASEDSLVVRVPEGAVTGFIRLEANGGTVETNVTFQTFTKILVTDFDGNGIVANDEYTFDGFTDQQAGAPLIRSSLPAPIDGNFMQVTGTDQLGTIWLGGPKSPGGTDVDPFGITTDVNSTFLEFDTNSNGRTNTFLQIVVNEQGNSADFTHTIQLNDDGWTRQSFPIVRLRNSSDIVVNPELINQIKFHIRDNNGTEQRLEANIDNVEFAERQ